MLLNDAAARSVSSEDIEPLSEAVRLNHVLVNQPFADADLVVETVSNLLEFYQAARNGEDIPLRCRPSAIRINRRGQSRDDFRRGAARSFGGQQEGRISLRPRAGAGQPGTGRSLLTTITGLSGRAE